MVSKNTSITESFSKSQKIINDIEGQINGTFITYWMSSSGSVCQNDVSAMSGLLKSIGYKDKIYLFIKSDGGTGRASLRMINLLRSYCSELIALIPLNCESAATMIALGADEIHMGPMAFLTPVDTSITHSLSPIDNNNSRVSIGTNELERIIDLWKNHDPENKSHIFKEIFQHIHPLAIAAVDRAGSLSNMLCNEIMSYHIKDNEKRERISHTLNSKYPSHSYPIVLKEAKRIGIPAIEIDKQINENLLKLNDVYSELCQLFREDFSTVHHRDNEVINLLESNNKIVYYKVDKEWHYSETERKWTSTNDSSSYRVLHKDRKNRLDDKPFYIR